MFDDRGGNPQRNAGDDDDNLCARGGRGRAPQRPDPAAWTGRLRRHAQGGRADRRGARSGRADGEARRDDRSARRFVFEFARDHDAYPASLNYRGYRKSICTSINHVVCHGIPDDKPLREGDIVNIDVTLIVDGWHGDASRMYLGGRGAAPRPAAHRGDLRGADARHCGREARRDDGRHRPRHPDLCRRRALLGGARLLRPRPRPPVP